MPSVTLPPSGDGVATAQYASGAHRRSLSARREQISPTARKRRHTSGPSAAAWQKLPPSQAVPIVG